MATLTLDPEQIHSVSTPIGFAGGLAASLLVHYQRDSRNWDPEVQPTRRALSVARMIASALDAATRGFIPHLAPSVGGGIQFSLRFALRELELEILPDGGIAYLVAQGESDQAGDLEPFRCEERVGILLDWLRGDA